MLLPVGMALLVCVFISGCKVGPDYVKPDVPVPDQWHEELAHGLQNEQSNLHQWWLNFDDPTLTQLIQQAREGNLSLKIAIARVEEARALRGVAKGEWYPDVDAQGTAQRTRTSEDTTPALPPGYDRDENFYSAGLDSSWEIDFWGRIRRTVESADASLQASVENYRDVLIILYAEVAGNYVEVRAVQRRIELALQNSEAQKQTLKLTQDRNAAGLVPRLDVSQAELNLARTESTIPVLQTFLIQSLNRLSVLLGDHPGSLQETLNPNTGIPAPHSNILVGIPSDIMRQRPDIRFAERTLAAQTARIGVATAELYPRFSLLGTFAFEAINGENLFDADSLTYGFGPAFRWNIFDGGRIRNNIRAEDARTEQALIQYEQVVLFALEDVENSMVAYTQEQDRLISLRRAVNAAQESADLVKELYTSGLTDFQNVLDMERSLFLEQDQLAESEGILAQNLIRIYKSLGGGWNIDSNQEEL